MDQLSDRRASPAWLLADAIAVAMVMMVGGAAGLLASVGAVAVYAGLTLPAPLWLARLFDVALATSIGGFGVLALVLVWEARR